MTRLAILGVLAWFAATTASAAELRLAQAYNIQSVPTMIVDGKFATSSDRVGTHDKLPPVLDALIVNARAERAKG